MQEQNFFKAFYWKHSQTNDNGEFKLTILYKNISIYLKDLFQKTFPLEKYGVLR